MLHVVRCVKSSLVNVDILHLEELQKKWISSYSQCTVHSFFKLKEKLLFIYSGLPYMPYNYIRVGNQNWVGGIVFHSEHAL